MSSYCDLKMVINARPDWWMICGQYPVKPNHFQIDVDMDDDIALSVSEANESMERKVRVATTATHAQDNAYDTNIVERRCNHTSDGIVADDVSYINDNRSRTTSDTMNDFDYSYDAEIVLKEDRDEDHNEMGSVEIHSEGQDDGAGGYDYVMCNMRGSSAGALGVIRGKSVFYGVHYAKQRRLQTWIEGNSDGMKRMSGLQLQNNRKQRTRKHDEGAFYSEEDSDELWVENTNDEPKRGVFLRPPYNECLYERYEPCLNDDINQATAKEVISTVETVQNNMESATPTAEPMESRIHSADKSSEGSRITGLMVDCLLKAQR